jgi:hypothetical protein
VGRESPIPNPAQIATDIVRQHTDSAFVAEFTGTLNPTVAIVTLTQKTANRMSNLNNRYDP